MSNTQEYKSPLKDAICEFKKKGIVIKKESKNPYFNSNYADLATILDAIEIEAANCGLTMGHSSKLIDNIWVLESKLECRLSDEFRISTFPLYGNKPQELGSSISYARRYNIQSLLNLAAEDDDGNAAQQSKPTAKQIYGTDAAMKKKYEEILDEITGALTHDQLKNVWAKNNTHVLAMKKLNEDYYDDLLRFKDERKAKITEEEAHNAAYKGNL